MTATASIGSVCCAASIAPTSSLICGASPAWSFWTSPRDCSIRAIHRAESLGEVILPTGGKGTTTGFTRFGGKVTSTMAGAVFPVGVAASTCWYQVVWFIVGRVVVEVVGAEVHSPCQGNPAPPAISSRWSDLVEQNKSANQDFSITPSKWVFWQVSRWHRHTSYLRPRLRRRRIFESGHAKKTMSKTNLERQGEML